MWRWVPTPYNKEPTADKEGRHDDHLVRLNHGRNRREKQSNEERKDDETKAQHKYR